MIPRRVLAALSVILSLVGSCAPRRLYGGRPIDLWSVDSQIRARTPNACKHDAVCNALAKLGERPLNDDARDDVYRVAFYLGYVNVLQIAREGRGCVAEAISDDKSRSVRHGRVSISAAECDDLLACMGTDDDWDVMAARVAGSTLVSEGMSWVEAVRHGKYRATIVVDGARGERASTLDTCSLPWARVQGAILNGVAPF